jgi:hypothetical protein
LESSGISRDYGSSNLCLILRYYPLIFFIVSNEYYNGVARICANGTGKMGVTNSMGEIFDGNGDRLHQGLVVCDGSVVPAAMGVNPFATITALAERSVELFGHKYGIAIDYDTKNG